MLMLSAPDFKQKQIVLAFLSHGDKLSFRNSNVVIKDQNNKIKLQCSCYRLFSLFVVGHATITTGLIQRAKKFGFSIVLMNHSLKPYAWLNSSTEGNILLRKRQYEYQSFDIAKRLVVNKIQNQIDTLNKIREQNSEFKSCILLLEKYKNRMREELDLKEILGLEGISSKLYFQTLFKEYSWKARRPRTKMDMTNTLLDIGYTILFNFMDGLVGLYGFDSYKGVYHQPFYQRKSLICDLVEPFRPLIDYRIRKSYNLKQIKIDDFTFSNGQYSLYGKKSLPYLQFFLETLIANKEEIFNYVQHYYKAFIRGKSIEEYPMFHIHSNWRKKAC